MRKIAFLSNQSEENIKKIMLHESSEGTYLFGFDTVFDTSCIFDLWFENLSDAEQVCEEDYGIGREDWILISDLREFCQQDLIMPIRIKGRESGKPQWGKCEILQNGKWVDYDLNFDKSQLLTAMTGNERLFVSGLLDEFESAKVRDKAKARKILEALQFDKESIEKILK